MTSLHDIWRGDLIPQSGVGVAIGRNSYDPPSPVVPVLDIHQRSAVLHDSGTPTYSGIIQYNSELEHLQIIPSQSGTQPITTAVYVDTYGNTSPTILGFSTPSNIRLDVVRNISSEKHFTVASNIITVWGSGIYEITLRFSCDQDGDGLGGTGNRTNVTSWLEQATLTGSFVEVAGSRGYIYSRDLTNGENSECIIVLLEDIAPGTRFRGRISNVGGIDEIGLHMEPNSYGLIIRRLG